ncbi:MAG: ATP-binding protein [Pseudanabaenaceae cyanobacterium bins.39]|nr:ATP-binding protein [Pseudanabaenaceae cyanobacterium bins.39]
MKIKRLEYCDHAKGWKLEPVEFSNLNLLVGVSGAGKTKILDAIFNLQRIAKGESLNGIEWSIIFSTKDNEEYLWTGKFKTIENSDINFVYEFDSDNQAEILNESLVLNQKLLVKREGTQIEFNGNILPKLSAFESVVEIFKNEKLIKPVWNGFRQINHSDETMVSQKQIYHVPFSLLLSKHTTEEDIINSEFRTQVKLALIYRNVPKLFEGIKNKFLQIFPTVEDIKIESFNGYTIKEIPDALNEFPFMYIKEKGVESWIEQGDMSSGMYRTIIHIAELYLSPHGSLIIIDEFENSLGINCIDAVTEDLILNQGDLQFILTSHHPYIINNIPMDYWKIVARKGGMVTVRNAKELNLGKSKHQAYLQLINKLETYNEEA